MIRFVQCLCRNRHCITAFVYVPNVSRGRLRLDAPADIPLTVETAADYMRTMVEALIPEAERSCGVCGSRDWHYADILTPYATMQEAGPDFDRFQRENALERAVIGGANRN